MGWEDLGYYSMYSILVCSPLSFVVFLLVGILYNTSMIRTGVEQIKFTDEIGTEPRFAFRRWLETWVEAVNTGRRDVWQPAILESVLVTDLMSKELDYEHFIGYLTNLPKQLSIPKATVSMEDGLFVIRGTVEFYDQSLMVFEGMFEMVAHDIGTYDYKIFGLTCYPHFRVTV